MANHLEPDLDGDDSSYIQRAVVLEDWWLVKCPKEFEGKRFGVAGNEGSVDTRAMRLFTSSPIIKAVDVFTLQASDGISITLSGFINKERVLESGFSPEIFREFIFGFPPRWESICNNCFHQGVPLGTDINIGSSIIDKGACPILSPCKNRKGNLRDKTTVTDTNVAEVNSKDGHSGGSRPRGIKTSRSKPPRLQSKSRGKTAYAKRKLELDKFQNTTNDGDHGSEGLKIAESFEVDKDECKAIDNEDNGRKPHKSKVQNHSHKRDQSREDLDKAKSSDVGKDECEAIDNKGVSPTDGCGRKHTGEDNVGESLTSKRKNFEFEETRASPDSLVEDLAKSRKSRKKQTSNKSGKALKSDGNEPDAEPMNHYGTTKVKNAEIKRKIDVSKVQRPTTDDGDHGSKGLNKAKSNNSSKQKEKSKKSEKTLKNGCNVVEPMNHSGSKVKEAEAFLSLDKLKRKIDFDVEVTPDKEVKKQKCNAVSIGSSEQKRSRSGRKLVSSLEYWRNQVPVYDLDRNLVEVREGHETDSTPSKGKGWNSPKPRR